MAKIYLHAPIVEAIIELRPAAPIPMAKLSSIRRRFLNDYPTSEDLVEIQTQFAVGAQSSVQQNIVGHVLSSDDRTDVLRLTHRTLAVSRRAPYEGWERLIERLQTARKTWNRIAGRTPLERIGVRFINRIDVPLTSENPIIEETDYLNGGTPRMPERYSEMTTFASRAEGVFKGRGCSYIVQVASVVPPPLIGHGSFNLDIDVYSLQPGPISEAALWQRLTEMRELKNDMFEAFITDKTRAMIDV